MFSPRGAYVTLIKANRNKSIEKARQAYLGHRAASKERKCQENQKRYGKSLMNHCSDNQRGLNKSESIEPRLSSRKKFRTLNKQK